MPHCARYAAPRLPGKAAWNAASGDAKSGRAGGDARSGWGRGAGRPRSRPRRPWRKATAGPMRTNRCRTVYRVASCTGFGAMTSTTVVGFADATAAELRTARECDKRLYARSAPPGRRAKTEKNL